MGFVPPNLPERYTGDFFDSHSSIISEQAYAQGLATAQGLSIVRRGRFFTCRHRSFNLFCRRLGVLLKELHEELA